MPPFDSVLSIGLIERECTRAAYLQEKASRRQMKKEAEDCWKRRHLAGYETLMNIRQRG